jgi:hypothetical protein
MKTRRWLSFEISEFYRYDNLELHFVRIVLQTSGAQGGTSQEKKEIKLSLSEYSAKPAEGGFLYCRFRKDLHKERSGGLVGEDYSVDFGRVRRMVCRGP